MESLMLLGGIISFGAPAPLPEAGAAVSCFHLLQAQAARGEDAEGGHQGSKERKERKQACLARGKHRELEWNPEKQQQRQAAKNQHCDHRTLPPGLTPL